MPLILQCSHNSCTHEAASILSYLKHSRLHQGSSRFKIKCPLSSCPIKFKFTNGLAKHLRRSHGALRHQQFHQDEEFCYKCTLFSCYGKEVFSIQSLRRHLQEHCEKHESVLCVFANCDKVFSCPKQIRKHFLNKHSKASIIDLKPTESFTPPLPVVAPAAEESPTTVVDYYSENGEDFNEDEIPGYNAMCKNIKCYCSIR